MHVLRMKESYQNDTLAISVDFRKNNNYVNNKENFNNNKD